MGESTKGSRGATTAMTVFVAWTIRVLLGVLLLLVLLTATILLVQPKLDLTPYRATIAQYLSTAVGRDIRLGGQLRIGLGRHVNLSLFDISMDNPAWADSAELFRASEASVTIDLFAVLSGVIRLHGVLVRDAHGFMEVSEDGAHSWDLGAANALDEVEADAGPTWRLVVEDASAENVSLLYRGPASARPFEIAIARFDQKNDAGMLKLDAFATANDLPVHVQGSIGTPQSLIAGRDIEVDLRADLDNTVVLVRGRFGDPQHLEDIEMEATVRGPSLAYLLNALGMKYDQGGDIDQTFKVMDRERGFAWESSGHIGALVLNTQGEVARPLELNDLRFTIRADGSNLGFIGRLFGVPGLPEQAYQLHGEVERDEKGLELRGVQLMAGETKLTLSGQLPQFPKFEQSSARLDVAVPDPARFAGPIGNRLASLGPLRGNVSLAPQAEGLAVLDVVADLGKNRLALQGPLGDYPDFRGSRIGFESSGPSLAALSDAIGLTGLPDEAYRLAGRLTVDDAARLRLDLDEGKAGDLSLAAQGFLGRVPQLDDADLAVSLSGASLRQVLGRPFLPEQAFEIKTRIFGKLRAPNVDKAGASLGSARLEMSGKFATGPMLAGTDVQFTAQIPRLVELIPSSSDNRWGRASYQATGRMVSSKGVLQFDDVKIESEALQLRLGAKLRPTDKGLAVSDLRAQLPEGEITAKFNVEQRDRPYVDLVATARGLDLGRFLTAEQVPDDLPPDAVAGARAIPDTPPSFGLLDAVDGHFRLTGESLNYPDPVFPDNVLVQDLRLDANLARGGLVLRKLHFSGDRGTFKINGALARTAQGVTVEGVLKANEFRLGTLAQGKVLEELPEHELDMQFKAQGRTYRELAASLDGTALLTGGSGRVANAGIEVAFGPFMGNLFATINPFAKKEPFTRVVCTAAVLQVTSGIAHLAPGFVIRTDKLDIAAVGTVDLNAERIDVKLKSTPRKGIGPSLGGLANRFVKVGGSLAKPAMVLDSGGALFTGTAAVATGGLSVIATNLFDRMSSAAVDPCAQIVAGIKR